ncbi:DUF998 domain-containing protein [Lysobacter sp. A6]|uniref:DUF998 domain-containing protein n=1 Tax=Noviluteimonas lactosilytica TaxID=2888523 RepID=A0ABS8JKH3_9GAMM|nr:DUF998 domain-containing protein [Lysobacter lactosilyticus]MCC8364112.1 DUF998 domain-containing protein [Lysobacter lactosilyticus]
MSRLLPPPHSTLVANTSLAGVGMFFVAAVAMHAVRPDLQWMLAPLSFYLVGEYAGWLKAAYVALAVALMLVGLQFRHALRPGARSDLAPWLFGTASLAVVVTAFADTQLPGGPKTTEAFVHMVAAPIAFLTVSFAMLLQSWHMRMDPAWRHRFAVAFALALACFASLWVHALVREWPRGLTQRGVIFLVLAWLALAATWLRAAARAQSFAAAPVSSS